jgi:hypothetical protein
MAGFAVRLAPAIVTGLLAAAPAYAQQAPRSDTRTWYQAYQDGRRQVRQNPSAAIASLEQAKRTGPKPGRRIPFYGDVFDDFLPDYHLGLAYLNAGRYQEANAAFDAVRQSGLITAKDREYAEFTKQSAAARTEFEKETLARATETRLAQTQAQGPPGLNPTQRPAQTQVQQTPIEQVQQNPVEQVARQEPSPNTAAQSPVQTAARAPEPNAANAPAPVAAPRPREPEPIPPARTQARNTPEQSRPRPERPAAARAPAPVALGSESSAMAAFFSGDYERAFTILSALGARDTTPRIDFYLACSTAALALTGGLTGDRASGTLDAARARFARLDAAQFEDDARFISPRVLETLRAAR